MKLPLILSRGFLALALLLSHAMCAVVAASYTDMLWGIRYACYSAPASTAFLVALPFLPGILICLALANAFHRRQSQ